MVVKRRTTALEYEQYEPPTVAPAQVAPAQPTIDYAAEERKRQKQISDDYAKSVAAAQIQPGQITGAWQNYTTAQQKTAGDYTSLMDKYLKENMEKGKENYLQYTGTMNQQIGALSQQQAALSGAAQQAGKRYEEESASLMDFFNNRVVKDYDETKADVKARMNATDAYYQNSIKPQYAKMMEGGLSLREASDPNNYVSQGVQGAYDKLIQKSQEDADKLSGLVKSRGQADYGVLAALGNQARGNTASLGAQTAAQTQLAQQANMNQASQAYQQAMQRVAAIEDQQRLYAQGARQTGLESGMDQSWKNLDQYRTNTGAALGADQANYQAMLAGDQLLANIATQMASARGNYSGQLQNMIAGSMNAQAQAASGVGSLGGQIGNFANDLQSASIGYESDLLSKRMTIPDFNYQMQSGFNQGNYATGLQARMQGAQNAMTNANIAMAGGNENLMMQRSDRMRQEDIALQKEAIDKQVAAAQAAQEAENSGSMWSSVLGTVGTIGGGIVGGIYGGPGGAMAGSALGGAVLGGVGNAIGGGGGSRYQAPHTSALAAYGQRPAASGAGQVPQLGSYWQGQYSGTGVGVAPTMQQYTLGGNYGYSPYSGYNLGVNYGGY